MAPWKPALAKSTQPFHVWMFSYAFEQAINLAIPEIVDKVNLHYNSRHPSSYRLPVLAIHTIMGLLVQETERYQGCALLPLERSSLALRRKNLIGDVNIVDADYRLFESYLIKHKTRINSKLIQPAVERLASSSARRFYVLNTHCRQDYSKFDGYTQHVSRIYGRQLIFDSVDRTLMYYLRLIEDTTRFVDEYVSNLETDPSVTFQLKQAWNEIVQG